MRLPLSFVVASVLLLTSGALAQAPVATDRFEVASVKPNASGALSPSDTVSSGRFIATNESLRNLITLAYRIPWFRVVGGPDWLSNRFDIVAKIPDAGQAAQVQVMLQHLLTDRFALEVHRETRDQPVYALVIARTDRRLGPQLHTSDVDCAQVMARRAAAEKSGAGSQAGQDESCSRPPLAPGHLTLHGLRLESLTNWLSGILGDRAVVDRTGLSGNFDVDLRYAVTPAGAPSDSPSIFTAVQEQLGLKLEPTRAPIEVLVIDSAQRPEPD